MQAAIAYGTTMTTVGLVLLLQHIGIGGRLGTALTATLGAVVLLTARVVSPICSMNNRWKPIARESNETAADSPRNVTLRVYNLKPMKKSREAAEADPLIAIAGGGGVALCKSQGNPWTSDYLMITGELDVDLRSNIAAEARAKIVYERLINFTDDPGTIEALQFLMTREVTHMKAFTAALPDLDRGQLAAGRGQMLGRGAGRSLLVFRQHPDR